MSMLDSDLIDLLNGPDRPRISRNFIHKNNQDNNQTQSQTNHEQQQYQEQQFQQHSDNNHKSFIDHNMDPNKTINMSRLHPSYSVFEQPNYTHPTTSSKLNNSLRASHDKLSQSIIYKDHNHDLDLENDNAQIKSLNLRVNGQRRTIKELESKLAVTQSQLSDKEKLFKNALAKIKSLESSRERHPGSSKSTRKSVSEAGMSDKLMHQFQVRSIHTVYAYILYNCHL